MTLYKSMVRPILEYGHAVWQPHLKGLQQELEGVEEGDENAGRAETTSLQ